MSPNICVLKKLKTTIYKPNDIIQNSPRQKRKKEHMEVIFTERDPGINCGSFQHKIHLITKMFLGF